MLISRTFAWMAVVAALVAVAAPASASPSYFDGTPYNGWEDQTGFATNDLVGYVNWIVYAPGSFPTTYSGYTPTHGEFAYVYQVFSQGTDKISTFEAEMDGDADNIGAFGAGVKPSGMPLASGDSAEWDFRTPDQGEIAQGQASQMLAFSSPYSPEDLFGWTQDGGNTAKVDSLPGPGSVVIVSIPEPSTLGLTLVGLGTWAAAWVVRRRQGKKGL